MTNHKMNVIVNCLVGEDFYASLRLLETHGNIFQLAKSDMKKKYKLGTYLLIINSSRARAICHA